MPAIGFVKRAADGSYTGELTTLTIRAPIEILPVSEKMEGHHPDFRVYASGVEIGVARRKIGQGSEREYISLSIAAPEFGPRRLTANLGRAACQSDENVFAIIWNPEN